MYDLFKAIGIGLVVILPLANPLTTLVLFLSLTSKMSRIKRAQQARMASIYVCIIMLVAWYGGQVVMNTFGISIPGLRIAGGLIVSLIGFRMLFPQSVDSSTRINKDVQEQNFAFVPLAMPSTAGPGTIAMIISTASTIHSGTGDVPYWVTQVAPPLVSILVGLIVWVCLKCADLLLRFFGTQGIEAISRLMGFLLVCMGVQYVINGVTEIITAWPK